MKTIYSFFNITSGNFFRLCNFLTHSDMLELAAVNNEVKQTIEEKIILYTPVYEKFTPEHLQSPQSWNCICSTYSVKKFYLSKECLFNTHSDAPGCYKIIMSWSDIIQRNPNINIDLENKSVFAMLLSIPQTEIESYIMRDNFQEYANPFHKKNLSSDPSINPKESTTLGKR